jgi:hypothetical protein
MTTKARRVADLNQDEAIDGLGLSLPSRMTFSRLTATFRRRALRGVDRADGSVS